MKVNWYIEKDGFEDDVTEIIREIEKRPDLSWKPIPDTYFFDRSKILAAFGPEECVISWGSIQTARVLEHAPWTPTMFCTFGNYDCTSYYPQFGKYLLNQNYVMLPLGDLVRHRNFLYSIFGMGCNVFIRPNRSDKVFTGEVVSLENIEAHISRWYDASRDTLCVVSPAKSVFEEWRLVISKGEVITGSQYKPTIAPGVPQNVLDYANEVLTNGVNPDLVWTLDICNSQDGLRVMEIGSFSCAGIYAGNAEKIVQAVSQAAWDEWTDIYELGS